MKLKLLPKFIISLGIVGLVLTIAVSLRDIFKLCPKDIS